MHASEYCNSTSPFGNPGRWAQAAAVGAGAAVAGYFHLTTHAFFKALLFLGSGSVIHAMSDEQDMRVMGGLKNKLPITYWTFLIGTLAIAGVFPLAGFFSKDEILWKAFSSEGGGVLPWAIGFIAAGMTAFYMMRLVVLTFFGENRATAEELRRALEIRSLKAAAEGDGWEAVTAKRLEERKAMDTR